MEKRKFSILVFSVYLFLLIWLVLFKLAMDLSMIPHFRSLNWIPFAQSVILNGKIYLKEIFLNVLIFVPFGVYVQYFKSHESILKRIGYGFLLSLSLEACQFIFSIGASDITDLLSNTTGVILGVDLLSLVERLFKNKTIKIVNGIGLIIESCALFLILFLNYVN